MRDRSADAGLTNNIGPDIYSTIQVGSMSSSRHRDQLATKPMFPRMNARARRRYLSCAPEASANMFQPAEMIPARSCREQAAPGDGR